MKKLNLGLLAVVLAVAASAFTVPASKETTQQELYWFDPGSTTQSKTTVDFATESDEETFVCPGNLDPCKDGYGSVTDLGNGNYQANGPRITQIKHNQ